MFAWKDTLKDGRIKGFASVKGKERVDLSSLLSVKRNLTAKRARYTKIHVQSRQNKCEDIDFFLILGEANCLLDVKKRSKPQKNIKNLPVR